MKTLRFTTALMMVSSTLAAVAQEQKDVTEEKKEDNRNVMFNASSANGPRQIDFGLPGVDTQVLENGLPVVFLSNPHSINSHWRGGASLSQQGLLNISQNAIATGYIGYAVDSYTQLGTDSEDAFHTDFNYGTSHFGKQQFDFNARGAMGRGWYYSGSVYQNFDPGSTHIRFTSLEDRTQIYKAALTKKYGHGRGQFSAIYHYSNSKYMSTATGKAPFIWNGDGSVSEVPGFGLGTSSYLIQEGGVLYKDMTTGKMGYTSFYDASSNRANQLTLMNRWQLNDRVDWTVSMKYDHATGSLLYQTPMSLTDTSDAGSRAYYVKAQDGSFSRYNGHVQSRSSCFNRGTTTDWLLTTELNGKTDAAKWRLGLNEWFYKVKYQSNTTMYDHTVEADPSLLYSADTPDVIHASSQTLAMADGTAVNASPYYNLNASPSEWYDSKENKLALYGTYDRQVNDRLNVMAGLRFEYQLLKGKNLAVTKADGSYLQRYPGMYIGDSSKGTLVAPTPYSYHLFNWVGTLNATYKVTDRFGLTGEFTYNQQHPNTTNFSGAEWPNMGKVTVPLGRGGIYWNTKYFQLTSLFSYIAKQNNNTTLNLINPNNPNEIKASTLVYDIQTLGWTTDAVITPFKGAQMHVLFTYQQPKYKNYNTSVTFGDGTVAGISASNNTVTEISKVIVELDPSYELDCGLKFWLSFRYFSKQYANIMNAYAFNGRWESFGGINWSVNKHLDLGCTFINFLNQTGASGSIGGADLYTKEQVAANNNYAGYWMAGNYLRPFTLEMSAKIHF